MYKYISLFVVLIFVNSAAHASAISMFGFGEPASDCKVTETVSLNLQFQGMAAKASDVQLEATRVEEAAIAIAKDLEVKKILVQSQNFSVNNQSGYSTNNYQYNGNISFLIEPYNEALKLMDRLQQQNYRLSLNVNKYNHCSL